ncbi:hypothetical protein UFOVP347_37 [uncultured Caudovirales phage]|uniref:Transglycosylase SLT domain-containing protein n=1 Tax=uncultured Caudovirales phage TaxID=2100421 RepID=A0A6J5LYP5_9CAUD|nr:hypothetical protein UFOVP347_37 [uncultured Caudovirales phage]
MTQQTPRPAAQPRPDWWADFASEAGTMGLDAERLARIAGAESRFQNIPNASGPGGQPTSSAFGPFQMTRGTFEGIARQYPELDLTDRTDPRQSSRATLYFTRDNIDAFRRQNGRDPSGAETYLMHFLGRAGAQALIGLDDNTPIQQAVSQGALVANSSLFQRHNSVGAVRAWAARHMGEGAGGAPARPFVEAGDLRSPAPVPDIERRRVERELATSTPGLLSGASDAVRQEWSLLWALRDRPQFAPDPDYRLTPERLRELTQGVPEQHWGYFSQATSEAHAGWLRDQMMRDLAAEQRLGQMGLTGVALRMGAAILDPLALGLTAATEGLALPAIMGLKASRLQRIAASAAAGAGTNAAVEGILQGERPAGEMLDVLYAAGFGLVLGGTVGAWASRPTLEPIARQADAVGRRMMDEAEQAAEAGGNLSAARSSYREGLREDSFDLERDATLAATPTAYGRARFDLAASLKNSENPMVSALGANLVEDAVGNADRSVPTAIGATERQALISRRMETLWRQDFETAFRDYAERQGWGWRERIMGREQFNEMVTDVARGGSVMDRPDPAVARAATAFENLMKRYNELASNPGREMGVVLRPVRGFGGEGVQNYVPRIFDQRRIDELVTEYGDENLRQLLAGSFRSRVPGLTPEDALTVAKGYLRTLRTLRLGEEMKASRIFSGEDDDLLRAMLREEGLDETAINRVSGEFKAPAREDGEVTRGKTRQLMDENFSMPLLGRSGEVKDIRIADFLVNDIETLFQLYNRSMSGHVALAQVRIKNPSFRPDDGVAPEYLVDGITNANEFDLLLRQVQSLGDLKGMSAEAIRRDTENLRFIYNTMTGVPHPGENTSAGQALRMVRDFNFVRVMNQVGFAQVPEMMNIAGQLGFRAMLDGMPSFRSLWRNAKTGRLDDGLAQEIEWMTTAGTDWLRGSVASKWDDMGSPMTYTGNSQALTNVDQALQHGKRVTTAISGMAPVNTLLQRWAAKAIVMRFARMAEDGVEASTDRLRTLGLDDDMVARIGEQMRRHAGSTTSDFRASELRTLGLNQWNDLEARSAFEHAVFRMSRRVIQENDIGMLSPWMSSPLAKTILQFRTFMVGAWTKQLLHNIHMRDFNTFAAFTGAMFAAGVAYTAQTHLQSIGRSDREKFLDERLSVEKLAAASFSRAGFASMIPMGMDTLARAGGFDPMFDFRTTGQASDVFFGNPTVGLMNDALAIPRGLSEAARGDFGQQDARGMVRALPFQNFLPFTSLYNTLISDLPPPGSR